VVGKYFLYNGNEMQVVGVVEDANGTTPATAAHLYLPLYNGGLARHNPQTPGLMGANTLYLTATSEADLETLRNEVVDVLNRNSQADQEWEHYYEGQPDVWWKNTFRTNCSSAPDIAGAIRGILYMLLALLFIPAINLCGMISSRMEERMSELGVRKAYGATNASLITQVLTENMMLTFVGGLVGLALAYLVAWSGSEWIFHLFSEWVDTSGVPPTYTAEMLFNPTLFLLVFGLCIVLNLISALVPTVLALRHSIIYSIQTKR
jgi:ABC-type lipoprotein release transport system permease subunit